MLWSGVEVKVGEVGGKGLRSSEFGVGGVERKKKHSFLRVGI